MPVRQMAPKRTSTHQQLVEELAAEWSRGDSSNSEPIIFEENDQEHRLAHVYVVWSRWSDIERVERSEIIMESAELRLPQEQVLNISIAMGLTPDDAKHMGFEV